MMVSDYPRQPRRFVQSRRESLPTALAVGVSETPLSPQVRLRTHLSPLKKLPASHCQEGNLGTEHGDPTFFFFFGFASVCFGLIFLHSTFRSICLWQAELSTLPTAWWQEVSNSLISFWMSLFCRGPLLNCAIHYFVIICQNTIFCVKALAVIIFKKVFFFFVVKAL